MEAEPDKLQKLRSLIHKLKQNFSHTHTHTHTHYTKLLAGVEAGPDKLQKLRSAFERLKEAADKAAKGENAVLVKAKNLQQELHVSSTWCVGVVSK